MSAKERKSNRRKDTQTDEQAETIAFLKAHAFDAGDGSGVERITTHISIILLAGGRAIKLKRPVNRSYVDFSTPELRLASCERELELNRRTAPALYLGVHRVTSAPGGGLMLDGDGALVDAFVEMVSFDEDGLFDNMAKKGKLSAPLMGRLAHGIAEFHQSIAPDRNHRGSDAMALVLDINERALATTDIFPADDVAHLNRRFRDELQRFGPLLDARGEAGKIRRCHGDLHLRNICLFQGEPTLFDCLEFDEDMATTDILYDLTFLLMDLWHRGLQDLANLVFNRYLDETLDEDGIAVLPFLMAARAAVRAHVTATQASEASEAGRQREDLQNEARSYFDLARDLLMPRPARLVAVGGLSGTGKSTVAAAIASTIGPPPGARILASDRIRKKMFRVPVETRLPVACYRPDISEKVYGLLTARAGQILELGHGVVADAVFDRAGERTRIADAAVKASAPFVGLWLEAPADELVRRVSARQNDPSDATQTVVRDQIKRAEAPSDWRKLNSEADMSAVARSARTIVHRAACASQS